MIQSSFISQHWQDLLNLSSLLLKLPSLNDQISTIKDRVETWLDCTIKITIFDSVLIEESNRRATHLIKPKLQKAEELESNDPISLEVSSDSKQLTVRLGTINLQLGQMVCLREQQSFCEDEIFIIKWLANQLTNSIETSLLRENAQYQETRLSTVAEISNAITSILDVDILLKSIASLIQNFLDFPNVYVFTVQKWQNKIHLRAEGTERFRKEEDLTSFNVSVEDRLLIQAIEMRKTVFTNDIPPNHVFAQLAPVDARSELILPLVFADQILGILCFKSEVEDPFSQSDLFLLNTLSDNIAVSLRNANLYRSEQWRRQVAESMRDAAGLLSADVSLTHLLDQLLEEITKILPGETAVIWLLETSDTDSGDNKQAYPLRLAALKSPDANLYDVLDQIKLLPTEKWLSDIFENHYPKVHDKSEHYAPFGNLFGYPENYSAIISPLWVGGQPIGILVLAHPQPDRYGREAQSIMATFGSYAAVAIRNTELYEAAHDQAWVSTVLLEVAEATQSINNLDELLISVARIIPQLAGVDACSIFLWDKDTEVFSPFASAGLEPEQEVHFNQLFIPKNQIAAFDQILISQKPVILNQPLDQQADTHYYFNFLNLERELLVVFPMISQSEVQGAILVDFSEIYNVQSQALWEEKYLIIQGIAYQTAVAVENIKLIQTQEEEAYISIALLQVAQAIVSSTEINDVMSVVARITPILVAMRRCAIYIWDFDRKVFGFSQSYGIPRSELGELPEVFKPFAFPLLECVRQSNQVACYMINSEHFTYSDWLSLDIDECMLFTSDELGSGDEVNIASKEVLGSRLGLILAYPLSIKGTVYGVMVTEEEITDRGAPTYHIRERRMEIVTGITQQVALALQNDILQREAIQRVRFDRELQLAREIQTNFMPDEMPQLAGWEIAVRWKPARQVGGDYYDVFELADGSIGLVIADVADKGMGAALFMTLVRTVLRATVRDISSPAKTLYAVNELLVPDSKNGMFVTLFYGILNPETGGFTYANAGHVPSLLIRDSSREIIELYPTAMALGIFPDIKIEDRDLNISPRDSLILYTDGVSEAFSPLGEMFGSERLKDMISDLDNLSASKILDSIESAVSEFIDTEPVSDDLTLVALHREIT